MTGEDGIDRWLEQWSWADDDLPLRSIAVAKRVARVARELERLTAATLRPLGLDPGEFDVLASLLRAGPPHELTPTALNRSLMMSAGGLTKRLGKLEERELITRRLSADDRRSLLVTLTEGGLSLARNAVRAHATATAEVIDRMGVDNRERLSGLLRGLLVELEQPRRAAPNNAQDEAGRRRDEPALDGGAQ
jgi:DNA-binding MarR family transcriptional regulator